MEMNVGSVDRLIRIFIGSTLLFLTFTSVIGLWGLLGALPVITGLSGYCLPYRLLGINTCAHENKSENGHA